MEIPDTSDGSETEKKNDHQITNNPAAFQFSRQGQWLAVYYDDQYYIGEVINFIGQESSVVQFLEKTTGRKDYFWWPRREDVAEIQSCYVFSWDFEVLPVSNDGRVWQVPEIDQIQAAYQRITKLS